MKTFEKIRNYLAELDRPRIVLIVIVIAMLSFVVYAVVQRPNNIGDADVKITTTGNNIQVSVEKPATDAELADLQNKLQAKNPDKKVTVTQEFSYSAAGVELAKQKIAENSPPAASDLYPDLNARD